MLPFDGAREQELRRVHARNQEHQPDGAKQQQDDRPAAAGDDVVQRRERHDEPAIPPSDPRR